MLDSSDLRSEPDWLRLVLRGARDLGLTGLPPRPMACHPCPPAWIMSRVVSPMRGLSGRRGVRLEQALQAGGLAVLDPWRVELAVAGLALSALRHSEPDDGLGLAVKAGREEAVFQVISTSWRWAARLEREQDPAATGLEDVAMATALRVAADHGGRVRVIIEHALGVAVRIHLPTDPEEPCRAETAAPLCAREQHRSKACRSGELAGLGSVLRAARSARSLR